MSKISREILVMDLALEKAREHRLIIEQVILVQVLMIQKVLFNRLQNIHYVAVE